jgi:hypothetical protein
VPDEEVVRLLERARAQPAEGTPPPDEEAAHATK